MSAWEPRDLLGLGSQPPGLPTISGLLYPGLRHLLSGESEAGKSWLAFAIAVDQAKQGNGVVLVDLEQGPRMSLERLRQLGLSDSLIEQWIAYLEPDKPIDRHYVELDSTLALYRPTLVVIDSLDKLIGLHGLDPMSNKDVDWIYERVIARLRANGAAVLIIDGVTKSREGRGRYSVGAGRKLYDTDVHFGITCAVPFGRGRTGRSKIEVHKDRGGHHRRGGLLALLHLESDPQTGRVTWSIGISTDNAERKPFRPTRLMEYVSRFLEQAKTPQSRNAIASGVSGNSDGKRVAMDVLVAEGFAIETVRGQARLIEWVRPYREADDPACDSTSPKTSPKTNTGDFAQTSPNTTQAQDRLNHDESDQTSPIRPNLAQTSPNANGHLLRPFAPPSMDGGEGRSDQAELYAADIEGGGIDA